MPRFRIYGARADTGENTRVTVTADTPGDAEAIAERRGILIERVTELEEDSASPLPIRQAPGEKTDKRWKLLMIFGSLGWVLGIVGILVFGLLPLDGPLLGGLMVSIALLLAGIVICIIARVGIYWHHG